MTNFNCINCNSSYLKNVKSIFESETEANYRNQESLIKTPTVGEILCSSNNITIVSQSLLALRLGNLDIPNLSYNYYKIEDKLTSFKKLIQCLEDKKINMLISITAMFHLFQVLFIFYLLTSFTSFVEMVSPNIGQSTLGFSMMYSTPVIFSSFLLEFIFLIFSLLNICFSNQSIKKKLSSKTEIERINTKIRIIDRIYFYSLFLSPLLIFSFWSFMKVLLSILFIMLLIYIFSIYIYIKIINLPYFKKKIDILKQQKQLEKEMLILNQTIEEKQKIWSNLYYCYYCDHVMDLDKQLHDSTKNINNLVNQLCYL